jgi:uncharacterized protein (DUF58 family)
MRRHGGPVFLVAMLALVIVGAGLRKWEVVAASLPALVIYGLIIVTHDMRGPKLTVRRWIDPDVVRAGKIAIVTVEVTNRRDSTPGLVEIFDVLPDTVELVKGKNHRIFDLGPYDTKRIKYAVRFHVQGDNKIGPTRWRSLDRAAFFFDEGVAETITTVSVQRLVEDPRKLRMPALSTHRPFGHTPARVKGQGSDFYGLREYVTTDPLRVVNWKASARRGKLISKEFEDERLGDVVLVIDMRPLSRIGEGSLNTVDADVNGALAVAQKVLLERNRLSIVYLRKGVGWIKGITSRRRIQEIVDKADFPEELETNPINMLPYTIKNSFPTRAHVVVFSPLLDDEMERMLKEVALVGYDVLLVSPSPASSCIGLYRKPVVNAALKTSRNLVLLRRKNRLLKLSKIMRVVDWDFAEALALTLKRIERQKGGVARWRMRARPVGA